MQNPVRTSFILITFQKGSRAFLEVVSIVSKNESLILGSIHIPDQNSNKSAFGLVVKSTTDQLSAMTGPLGKIPGVKVKSAVLPLEESHD